MRSCAVCTSRGYYLRVAFISLRASDYAATIRGWCGYYSRVVSNGGNTVANEPWYCIL